MSNEYLYDMPAVAAQIRTAARQKNAIIKEMLAQCGLGINALSAMNHGKEISSGSLAKIADYLDVSVDYLLGRTDDPQAHKSGSPVTMGDVSNSSGTAIGNSSSSVTINSANSTGSIDKETLELAQLIQSLPLVKRAEAVLAVEKIRKGS